MKKLLLTFAFAVIAQFSFGQTHVHVNGYYKKDGTYVQSHYRTSPNNTVMDNWSTYPNVNPYTGNVGTRIYYNQPVITTPSNSNNLFRTNDLYRTNDLFRPNPLFN
jgi:hypothetical protein